MKRHFFSMHSNTFNVVENDHENEMLLNGMGNKLSTFKPGILLINSWTYVLQN